VAAPQHEVVHLRPLVPGDAQTLASWARDVAFCQAADWSADLPYERYSTFWRDLIQAPPPDLIRLGVIHEGVLAGYIDLHGSEPTRRELGFVIGSRDRWARGLGRRAAAAALRYGFQDLRLNEVWAKALDANQRSVRLLQRLGMRETARGDEAEFLCQPTFYRQFILTASEWRGTDRPKGPG